MATVLQVVLTRGDTDHNNLDKLISLHENLVRNNHAPPYMDATLDFFLFRR
jgi:hypothetical protein